jgi:hypothetical protein
MTEVQKQEIQNKAKSRTCISADVRICSRYLSTESAKKNFSFRGNRQSLSHCVSVAFITSKELLKMLRPKEFSLTRSKSRRYDRKTVADDVYLYQTIMDKPSSIHLEVECNRFTSLYLTLDLSESQNYILFRYDEKGQETLVPSLSFTVKVKPFSTVSLGCCKAVEGLLEGSSLLVRWGCVEEQPDEREVQKYLQDHRISMQKRLTEAENALFPSERIDLDGSAVHKIYEDKGISFVDLSFPPLQQSIFQAAQWEKLTKEKKKELEEIEWKRAKDFMKPTSKDDYVLIIQVFENGIEAADILQGGLDDCWFLSSLAALAEYPDLVKALFPPCSREYNDSGVYFVRFCKNGLWTSVRVDDYIPCFPGSGPVFTRSHGNELWALLAEKAYAKLHGSYVGIQSGQSYEALMDLTGAPFRIIELPETIETEAPFTLDSIWNGLVDGINNHYIMSSNTRTRDAMLSRKSTAGTDEAGSERKAISFHHHGQDIHETGLVSSHSYTILAVKQTSTGVRLVKLR